MEVLPISNGGTGFAGSAGLGAALGGFVGSAFGSDGGLFGGRNNNVAGAGIVADTAILDSLSNISNSINNANIANLQGNSGIQSALCQGFGGVNNTINQGNAGIQAATSQGFSGLNTSILTSAQQSQLTALQNANTTNQIIGSGMASIAKEIADCCCVTNATTVEQANLTRSLITQNRMDDMAIEICDGKAKIAALEASKESSMAIQALEARTDAKLSAMTNSIINHMSVICPRPFPKSE